MNLNQLRDEEYALFPKVSKPSQLAKRTSLTVKSGVQKLVELDRYSLRDNTLQTLKEGDVIIAELQYDPKYPVQGYGRVKTIDKENGTLIMSVEFPETLLDKRGVPLDVDLNNFERPLSKVVKPLEVYWEQIAYRVARGAASVEKTKGLKRYWFKKFFNELKAYNGIPGGRILYGAGSGNNVTLFNCFVLPAIPDSRKGISRHRETTMEIMSRGGGVGSNGSALRPKNEIVVGVNGKSSGSVSWLNDLSKLTDLVQQGGSRRGAQMIGLADWHPDLVYFMMCKIQNPHVLHKIAIESPNQTIAATAESLLIRNEDGAPVGVRDTEFMTGANISILVSDDFMKAVEEEGSWTLRFPDIEKLTPEQKEYYDNHWHESADVRKWEELGYPVRDYETFEAKDLWDLINVAARYSAEPGVIFIDTCNKESNCWYYAPLVVTNPCGEQPLPPYAVCNLFAINLANFYDAQANKVDYPRLRRTVRVAHRFADNIIDHSFYFLEENEKMAKAERRIGLGVMGLADLLIFLKQAYGSDESLETIDELFKFIRDEVYLASTEVAKEKGAFEYFDAEKYLQSGFVKRLPQHIQDAILLNGIRNVCNLTVAPTGSTGTMAGVATGLEPYFAFKYFRSGRLGKFIEVNTDIAQAYFDANPEATELPDYYVAANDLEPLAHVRVQSTIQKYIDSAISKTCNAPSTFTVEDNKNLYLEAFKQGCKGVTVYVDSSRESQVLSLTKEETTFESLVANEETATVSADLAEELEVSKVLMYAPSETEADLGVDDTRACTIRFENGQLIKEC